MLDKIIETAKDLLDVGKAKYLVYVFIIAHITTFVFLEDSIKLWEEVISHYINPTITLFLQNFFIVTFIVYSAYVFLREIGELLVRGEVSYWFDLKEPNFVWLFFIEYVCFSLNRGVCSFDEYMFCYIESMSFWVPFVCFLIVFVPKAIFDEYCKRREQRYKDIID